MWSPLALRTARIPAHQSSVPTGWLSVSAMESRMSLWSLMASAVSSPGPWPAWGPAPIRRELRVEEQLLRLGVDFQENLQSVPHRRLCGRGTG